MPTKNIADFGTPLGRIRFENSVDIKMKYCLAILLDYLLMIDF